MRDAYGEDDTVKVFTKGDGSNREYFGLNELLYDVCVCRVAPVLSATQRRTLWYVKEPLWHIESEFARNSAEALKDFNKLVLGAAPTKVFIGPGVHDPDSFIEVLRLVAMSCSGTVHCALVPHPEAWDQAVGTIGFFTLRDGPWVRRAAPP